MSLFYLMNEYLGVLIIFNANSMNFGLRLISSFGITGYGQVFEFLIRFEKVIGIFLVSGLFLFDGLEFVGLEIGLCAPKFSRMKVWFLGFGSPDFVASVLGVGNLLPWFSCFYWFLLSRIFRVFFPDFLNLRSLNVSYPCPKSRKGLIYLC